MPSTARITAPMPEPMPCPHCKKTLHPRTAELCGQTVFCGFEPCDCPGALEEQREWEAEHERAMHRAEIEARERKVSGSGIPPRYREATHPWAEHMANLVREGRGFYIWGANGSEKTLLACSAALLCLDAGLSVRFAVATELLDELREFGDGQRQLLDGMAQCDLLVIDDLGKEGAATPRAAEKLFDLFNKRYNAETKGSPKPTIVTSNFPRDDLPKRISLGGAGLAIASRLQEMTQPVEMDRKDGRIANGKRRHSAQFPARLDG